ncbi:MAG: rRNA maturation RNase YbeY [Acidobacteriaceae bacterium]|nr:rRNA maturation RNase YbeY [Acidobacteriaceae bacterium]
MSRSAVSVLFRALPESLEFSAEEKRSIRSFAQTLSTRLANRRPFVCVISDDSEVRRLNSAFRRENYATDVLSFPSAASGSEIGEMIISAERAEAQAREFGHGRTEEICILMLHGLLHLSGMDHESDRGDMARAEGQWREEFGLPSNLIARSREARSMR